MTEPQALSRTIVISEQITDELAREVISIINSINEFDNQMSVVSTYQPTPIEIYINSGGGSATAGFAIVSAIEMSETPVVTFGLGIIASMALAIFASGDYRLASRHARFMYHSVSYDMMGHITDHESMYDEASVLQDTYDGIFLERTKLCKNKMAEIRKLKKDYFFGADEAVSLGIADEVIKKIEKKIVLSDEDAE